MMRRAKPENREILPDVRYNSTHLQTLVQHVLKMGKKSLAVSLVYGAMDLINERTGKSAIEVFDSALKNVSPAMEVRPRRVGGATYQVPMEVSSDRRLTLAIRWILSATRERSGKSFSDKLASELIDASNETGAAIRKRDETHKMAEANRAFSHYRV
ncbi:MAG TPA: 30S ribosomal protein S7 [Anaerolineae bacterium]|nr:30S ribosomal protein S7 [Anaerolineae bacterium]